MCITFYSAVRACFNLEEANLERKLFDKQLASTFLLIVNSTLSYTSIIGGCIYSIIVFCCENYIPLFHLHRHLFYIYIFYYYLQIENHANVFCNCWLIRRISKNYFISIIYQFIGKLRLKINFPFETFFFIETKKKEKNVSTLFSPIFSEFYFCCAN